MSRAAAPLTLLIALVGGCAGGEVDRPAPSHASDGGALPPDVPVTPLSLCTRAWEALCPAYRQCLPAIFASEFDDDGDCVARSAAQCVRLKWADGSRDTLLGEARCVRELPQPFACDALIEGLFAHTAALADCVPPMGRRPDGAPCGYYVQCASGTCHLAPGSSCGSCGPAAALGALCATTYDCEGGAVCVAARCVRLGQTGLLCSAAAPCNLENDCVAGGCVARAGEGAPCRVEAPFSSCAPDLVCNAVAAVCERAGVASDDGAACGLLPSGGFALCPPGRGCRLAGPSGVCVRLPADGEPCDPTLGNACVFGSACTSGRCARVDPRSCE